VRALVTGAGGFVGRHLVDRLRSDGWDVVALTRAQVDLADARAGAAAAERARAGTDQEGNKPGRMTHIHPSSSPSERVPFREHPRENRLRYGRERLTSG